ncbi:zinc finger CCCH domain-containing protein 10 [Gadus macrocephalus]|uniref:zinc finger CCCH domain-containing protein 10 n=1 Tax=Gadus macrocephalus TaxID=80720 RepID=UPI0028CB1BEA|nr:zinc finger CCCH domain-containing protein 10 [Gadus macrocephalus]
MPDRDSSYLSAGGGGGSLGEEGGRGSGSGGGSGEGLVGSGAAGSVGMGGGGALGNGSGGGGAGGGAAAVAAAAAAAAGQVVDGVCRDFVRNVCKRGKRCRFRHPDFSEVSDLGVQKNEFVFCHDHQNRECLRSSCRFVHGSKDDEDCYKRSGELPPRLRGKVAARLGLSPTDLPHSRGEVPLCRDFLKGECQRGSKCKFRHVKKDYEFEPAPRAGVGGAIGAGSGGGGGGGGGMVNAGGPVGGGGGGGGVACGGMAGLVGGVGGGNVLGMGCPSLGVHREAAISGVGGVGLGGCLSLGPLGPRRYERGPCSVYDPLFEGAFFEPGPMEVPVDHGTLQLKRRRLEGLRLVDASGGGHFELGVPAPLPPRPLEYRFLEEENCLLRKRVEELKKQVSNLLATNDVLLEQNAQYRSQAKVITLTSTPLPSDSLGPAVVSSYNHSIAQTHTTLSSGGLQPRVVTQQDLASSIAPPAPPPIAAPPAITAPHLSAEITPLAAALVQTIAQGLGTPVSMASVAVSVAPVAVSLSQPMVGLAMSHATAGLTMSHATAGLTMSHATAPMVSYPIASQSMRITTLPH